MCYRSIKKFGSLLILIHLYFMGSCDAQQIKSLSFPAGKNPVDSLRTLESLTKIEGLEGVYLMTYYGSYEKRLESVNRSIVERNSRRGSRSGCSLFFSMGNKDQPLYGRNFDNPTCGVLITYYQPESGYASIGFTRINDLGFPKRIDPDTIGVARKSRFLNAPHFVPCGLNEKGLAAALAYIPVRNLETGEKSIFITHLIRKLLDHAATVDEAKQIILRYRTFDAGLGRISHHILIADASGQSVIAEPVDGRWEFMSPKTKWQVATNSPLYDRTEAQRKADCWRYKKLIEGLEKSEGDIDMNEAMRLLQGVSFQRGRSLTIWSFIADLKQRQMVVSFNCDYDQLYRFEFKNSP